MALSAGFNSRAGIGLESLAGTYGTLVAPTLLAPYLGESLKFAKEFQDQAILMGKAGMAYPTKTGQKVAGGFKVRGGYRDIEYLVFAALGGADTKTGSVAPYVHTIEPADTMLRAMSVIVDDVVTCRNYAGCKINKMTIDSSAEGVVFDFDLLGFALTEATTHRAALAALAFLEHYIMFHHQLVLRVADCTDALAVGDIVNVSKVKFELDNALSANAQTATSGVSYPESKRTNFRKVSLTFTLPRREATTLTTLFLADTKCQADLIWTGPTLGAGNYLFQINLPTVYIKNCDTNIGGPQEAPVEVTCDCYKNNGNTNMTETDELQVVIQNSNASAITWTA